MPKDVAVHPLTKTLLRKHGLPSGDHRRSKKSAVLHVCLESLGLQWSTNCDPKEGDSQARRKKYIKTPATDCRSQRSGQTAHVEFKTSQTYCLCFVDALAFEISALLSLWCLTVKDKGLTPLKPLKLKASMLAAVLLHSAAFLLLIHLLQETNESFFFRETKAEWTNISLPPN